MFWIGLSVFYQTNRFLHNFYNRKLCYFGASAYNVHFDLVIPL